MQKSSQEILPFCTFVGPSPHPQHPPAPSARFARAFYTPLLGLHSYRIQGITHCDCFNETAVNRFATVVLETFGDISGAAVLCVTLYGNDGVAHLYAANSARNIVSPDPREPG